MSEGGRAAPGAAIGAVARFARDLDLARLPAGVVHRARAARIKALIDGLDDLGDVGDLAAVLREPAAG